MPRKFILRKNILTRIYLIEKNMAIPTFLRATQQQHKHPSTMPNKERLRLCTASFNTLYSKTAEWTFLNLRNNFNVSCGK